MPLTAADFEKISQIVRSEVRAESKSIRSEFRSEIRDAVAPLATKQDLLRSQGLIIDAMDMLQRDTFARLDKLERKLPA